MKKSIENALPIAEAVARLLHPFAEVVLHDLETNTIAAIYNPYSRREVGDCSFLEEYKLNKAAKVIGPYSKINWDGRRLKSISVILTNEEGIAEGMFCINVDLSHFGSALQSLQQLIAIEEPNEKEELFQDDLYEKINIYVQDYCRKKQMSLEALGRAEKRELVRALEQNGAFSGRNAASYAGRILGISRATVYNYLKEGEAS